MRWLFLAVLCAMWGPVGSALAAPQILGLVTTADTPTELKFENGMCSAEFSAICLQKDRSAPEGGALYRAVNSAELTFVITGEDGVRRRSPATGLTIRSARSYAAVNISVPESVVTAFGGGSIALDVGKAAALMPIAEADDPEPQTGQDIAAALETYRNIGQATIVNGSPVAQALRGMMVMINALHGEANRRAGIRESRLARDTLRDVRMSAEARAFTEEQLAFCENLASGAANGWRFRPCLQHQHDAFITNRNRAYWDAAAAGS